MHPDGVAVRGVRVVAGGQQQHRSAGAGGPRAGVALGGATEPRRAGQGTVGPHGSGVVRDGGIPPVSDGSAAARVAWLVGVAAGDGRFGVDVVVVVGGGRWKYL